jgi:cytochrome c biogenesis protein CcmG/thiol:disulfide interchange protein DsbE
VNLRRPMALGVLAVIALAACGGDDSASPDSSGTTTLAPETSSSDESSAGTSVPDGDVVPTIAPDVPEEWLPGVGPLAVVGEPLPQMPASGDDPAVGLQAPVIIAETVDGEPVRLDAAVDGPTWLVFLAHWCPHCNAEIPVINELRDTGRIPDGVNVVAISTAYAPDRPNWPPTEWLADMDWTYTAIRDGIDPEAAIPYIALAAFGVGGYPFSVLLDGDGRVVTRFSGEHEADELASLVDQAFG